MSRRKSWLARFALVGQLVGVVMIGLAIAMIPPAVLAHFDATPDLPGHIRSMSLVGSLGLLFFLLTRRPSRGIDVGHREGFLIVGIGWIVVVIVGALPFYFYAHSAPNDICNVVGQSVRAVGSDFCSFTHAVFESASGFTTTGASIITDGLWVEPGVTTGGRVGLPRGILLWRSLTHFIGGMGIIVLGVAVFPLLGVGGMQLFKAEVPGPTTDKLVPRVGETAKLLWKVYLFLSIVLFVFLSVGGMNNFEAICHTMSTMATGGFSTRAASVGGFGSAYTEWVLSVFMLVAGTNFTLHFAAISGRFKPYWRDLEFRTYLSIISFATLFVTVSLLASGTYDDSHQAARDGLFQVASILTGTGFASTDYEAWGPAPLALGVLVILFFVGGMAGSTCGGVKIVRHILLVRVWVREIFFLSHPHAVRPVRLGNKAVPPEVIRSVMAFMGAYLATFVLGALFFCLDGLDLVTALTCSAASLGNIGPGLGEIGPMDNYAGLSVVSKWVSSIMMILGRLELFTLLMLISPAFWRR